MNRLERKQCECDPTGFGPHLQMCPLAVPGEYARQDLIDWAHGLGETQAQVERLRTAAKRVLEADMLGVRDLDALNALEDAAGFTQQGQDRRFE